MPAVGLYATQSDVEDIFGPSNVAAWSQLDPTQPPLSADVGRIQRALDYADARVVSTFRNYGNYATPLAPRGTDADLVRRWAATLAGVWLYDSRGQQDATPEGNKYTAAARAVLAEMAQYRGKDKLDAAPRWPAPSSPVG